VPRAAAVEPAAARAAQRAPLARHAAQSVVLLIVIIEFLENIEPHQRTAYVAIRRLRRLSLNWFCSSVAANREAKFLAQSFGGRNLEQSRELIVSSIKKSNIKKAFQNLNL